MHTYTHMHKNTCTCTHARARTHTHARTHVRTHTHTHARTHAHTHTHIHTRTHAHTHACTHAHTHACTHAHTHAHTLHLASCPSPIIYLNTHLSFGVQYPWRPLPFMMHFKRTNRPPGAWHHFDNTVDQYLSGLLSLRKRTTNLTVTQQI